MTRQTLRLAVPEAPLAKPLAARLTQRPTRWRRSHAPEGSDTMPIAKFLTASLFFAAAVGAQSLTGRWDCTVTVGGNEIPFRMEFSGDGASVAGDFFNGDERVPSTGGQLQEGSLRLNFDQYASRLEVTLKDGALEGRYGRDARWYPFRAQRAAAHPTASTAGVPAGVPDISGL